MRKGGRTIVCGGSSLVEVLVSLLLLALGLLGRQLLQLHSSLRARHESALLSAGVPTGCRYGRTHARRE